MIQIYTGPCRPYFSLESTTLCLNNQMFSGREYFAVFTFFYSAVMLMLPCLWVGRRASSWNWDDGAQPGPAWPSPAHTIRLGRMRITNRLAQNHSLLDSVKRMFSTKTPSRMKPNTIDPQAGQWGKLPMRKMGKTRGKLIDLIGSFLYHLSRV